MEKTGQIEAENSQNQSASQYAVEEGQVEGLDCNNLQNVNLSFDKLKTFVDSCKCSHLQDDECLKKYIAKFQKYMKINAISYDDILKLAEERIQRMVKNGKMLKNWRADDKRILHWIVINLAKIKKVKQIEKQFTHEDWTFVSSLIPGSNPNSCMFKWLGFHKIKIYQANWSQQQSSLLKVLVAKYVNVNKSIRWKDVCKKLYLQNENSVKNYRTPKQCKEHWNFKLNPNLRREPWTQQQDILLLKTVKQNSGLKKWVEMVKLFHGRTQNAVKNRYNLIIEKQKKCLESEKDELQLVQNYLQRCYLQKNIMIIEPDSQQCMGMQSKSQIKKIKKGKNPRKNKKSTTKKEEQQKINFQTEPVIALSNGVQLIAVNPQYKGSVKIQQFTSLFHQQRMSERRCCGSLMSMRQFEKEQEDKYTPYLERQHPINTKSQQVISLQNLPQINNHYDHRVNDFEFNFMNIDSSG